MGIRWKRVYVMTMLTRLQEKSEQSIDIELEADDEFTIRV